MKKRKNRWLFGMTVMIIIFVILLGIWLFLRKKTIYEISPRVENIASENEKYADTNNEVLGWIRVQGTDIDYPVLDILLEDDQMNVNYAWKNTEEKEVLEDHTIVYGHNIKNVSSHPLIKSEDHFRFEQLLGFVYYDYAKENLYIQYSTQKEDYLFQIYAISFFNTGDIIIDEMDKKEYIERSKEDSFYQYDVDVDENDPLITLVTCTRFYGYNKSYQFKIDGRLLREGERATTFSVEKNLQVYEEIEQKLKEVQEDEEEL